MFGWFKKRPRKNAQGFRATEQENARQTWQYQTQPDPGSGPFAYNTLGLAPMTPVGTGVTISEPIDLEFEQVWAGDGVVIAGIATNANGIRRQPLYDPRVGMVNAPVLENGQPSIPVNWTGSRLGNV